jgi:hypothetical protein
MRDAGEMVEEVWEPPAVEDPSKVGTFRALAKAGGGYVWDEVLEYRVWCHPSEGARDDLDGDHDYYCAFATYADAQRFAEATAGAQEPLALVLQQEYIDEPSEGEYVHVREPRIAEWPVPLLRRPRRTAATIPDFMRPDAPPNRLEILRGQA